MVAFKSAGSALTEILGRGMYFFLINDLNVAINRNSFPFRYRGVIANLLEGDCLSFCKTRVCARQKRDMRFLERVSRAFVDESKSTHRDDVEGYPALDVLV